MKATEKQANRWLIFRQGAIGDTILLSPLIQSIRTQIPDAWIEIMGVSERVELLIGYGLADKSVSSERAGMEKLYSSDGILPPDLNDYFRSFDVILFFSAKHHQMIQQRLTLRSDSIVRVRSALPPANDGLHCIDRYLSVLDGILPTRSLSHTKISLKDSEVEEAKAFLTTQEIDATTDFLLALHPGAGSKTKQAPASFFAEAANAFHRRMKTTVLITQGPADEEAVKDLKALVENDIKTVVFNALPLRKLAAVLSQVHQFIGNDSGITHMAAALERPTLALFKQSDPAIWSPRGKRVRVVLQKCSRVL